MTTRTASEIYQTAVGAGFAPAAAVIATAIALAESSGRDDSVGDTALQNATWGPSVGLWQIRTLIAQTGTGSDRDIRALTGDIGRQALSAYRISSGGTSWDPWTVYRTGAYRQYLGQAQTAAGGAAPAADVGLGSDVGSLLAESLAPARRLALTMVAVVAGLGLIGAGLWRVTGDVRAEATRKAEQAAKLATMVM